MQFPKTSRYDLIMKTVYEFIRDEEIYKFPIDPFKIIEDNKWGVITYSELAIRTNTSIEQIAKAFQSEDAYIMRDDNNYTIAYNDTVEHPLRIRFTLMHEIGHIKLNHLLEFDKTVLRRSTLTKDEYEILEREANAFARNVLFPPFLYETMRSKFRGFFVDDSSGAFLISPSAVKTRLKFLQWDLQHIKSYLPKLLPKFQGYINYITDSKQCLKCRHHFISRFARFCPVCSHTKFTKRREENYMIYSGFELDENSRFRVCGRCNNEEIDNEDQYCKICATQVVNKCTNVEHDINGYVEWECGELASGNARYCTKCGHQTVFHASGLLKSWDQEIEEAKKAKRAEMELIFAES